MVVKPFACVPLLILGSIALGFPFVEDLYEGGPCPLENGETGICKLLPDCAIRLAEVREGRRNSNSAGRCGFSQFTEIVCCPLNISEKIGIRPADSACQQYDNEILSTEVLFHILGGVEASPGEFPFMAALGYIDTENEIGAIKYTCGGTLISSQHVLTAAHCVSNINELIPIEVRIGSEDLTSTARETQRIPISDIITHPRYKRSLNYNDVAILKLRTPVRTTNSVRPICLQTRPLRDIDPKTNISLIVIGWGATDIDVEGSTKLMKATNLSLVEKDTCAKLYTGFRKLPQGLDDNMLCAMDTDRTRRSDACQGDSGGPLLLFSKSGHTVVGVTSFGQNCGDSTPGVYTSVFSYLDWIEAQVWPEQSSD